jgi:HPt (histidine-containing phosphotransfer) domain-containing protein
METKGVIDLSYLRQLANGSDEFMETMITIFISETPLAIEQLEISSEKKDWAALKAIAHKMKPSFGFMGISGLKEVVEGIESEASEGKNILLIEKSIRKLKSVCTLAIQELRLELNSYHKPASSL